MIIMNDSFKKFYVTKETTENIPTVVEKMPEDRDSYEICVFINCNVNQIGNSVYEINHQKVYDVNHLVNKNNTSHIVTLTNFMYDENTGIMYNSLPTIVHAGNADDENSSDFHAFFYFKNNEGTLCYEKCSQENIQSWSGVVEKSKEMNTTYIVSVVSNVFVFEQMQSSYLSAYTDFNGGYSEIITDEKATRILSFDGIDKILEGHKIAMLLAVGYDAFDDTGFGITDHLYNHIDFFE